LKTATLARLSADELAAALKLPGWVHPALVLASRRLAKVLARFDDEVAHGLPSAATRALAAFGISCETGGNQTLPDGAAIVLANHPGAFDALALFAAIGRDDVRVLALDRPFLAALPGLSKVLIPVPQDAVGRAVALRTARRHLANGGLLLHFPAGAIEPDPAIDDRPHTHAPPWQPGLDVLLAADTPVTLACVANVHHARIERSWPVAATRARGVTLLGPLVATWNPRLAPKTVYVQFATSSGPTLRNAADALFDQVARRFPEAR
jgi:putative hemolysin